MSVKVMCYKCEVEFWLNDEFYRVAKQRAEAMSWYCPNGHSQVFTARESEADQLRRERDRLVQRLAQKDDEIANRERAREAAERRVSAARGQITKLKKRASNGICPCCNRTFANLARHMGTKHPGFIAEPDATEHVN